MAFIGIDRGIVNHWIYEDAEYFKVWFEMLYRARYSQEPETKLIDGILVEMNYGEFIYGRTKWSERLKISERRLRTLIDKLQRDNMIESVTKFPRFTVYRIINYAKYNQQNDQQEDQSGQGIPDFDDHPNDQRPTSRRPAGDQRATTKEQGINKVNKSNKGKQGKTYTAEFDEFWNVYPRKLGKLEAFKTWERIIKKGESPTVIIQCASNYAQDCINRKTEEQYIKHPKTFLNDERYKDYMVIVLSKQPHQVNKWDQMIADEEAKKNGTHGYYPTGTDLFS